MDCLRFWEQNKRLKGTVFFLILQPSLAVLMGKESRRKSGKFSRFKGESLGWVLGVKIHQKSKFLVLVEGHGFWLVEAVKTANFYGFRGCCWALDQGGKAWKFSGLVGERSRVISVVKSNRKTRFWGLRRWADFGAACAANFGPKIRVLAVLIKREI